MHIFRLKEGTKSYDWVKDVIGKERKQKRRVLWPHPKGDTIPVN